jgi:hypothetical protein
MLKAIPKEYHDPSKGTLKLLWEEEWRALGITQVSHNYPPQFKRSYWSAIESWMGALRSSWTRTAHTSLQVGTSRCVTSQLANIFTGDQSTTSHQANRDVVGSLVTNLIWFWRFLRGTRRPEATRTPWRCYVSCLSIHYNSWHSLLLQMY